VPPRDVRTSTETMRTKSVRRKEKGTTSIEERKERASSKTATMPIGKLQNRKGEKRIPTQQKLLTGRRSVGIYSPVKEPGGGTGPTLKAKDVSLKHNTPARRGGIAKTRERTQRKTGGSNTHKGKKRDIGEKHEVCWS